MLLLPRKPPPVPSSDDKAGGGGKKKEKGSSEEAVPQPSSLEDPTGLELDQQLVVHTYNTALTSIQSMVRQQQYCVFCDTVTPSGSHTCRYTH